MPPTPFDTTAIHRQFSNDNPDKSKIIHQQHNEDWPSASSQTGLNTTGLSDASRIVIKFAKSSDVWLFCVAFTHRNLWDDQFWWKNGAGILLSIIIRLVRRVPTRDSSGPKVGPDQANSLAVVARLNLCDMWRRFSFSSLCWCLLSARGLVVKWFW